MYWSSVVCSSDLLAGQWVFLSMFWHGEAAQIAQHHQNVLIHRISMKQIVLHLADYASKHGQVAGQYVQHGHPAQRMDDAARLLQYLDELATVDRVAPELGIDASAGKIGRAHV